MNPELGFRKFSTLFLDPIETECKTIEGVADLAIRMASDEVRRAAETYIADRMADGTDLSLMWARSNARIGPTRNTARSYTSTVLARLRDSSVPSRRTGSPK